jgi:hypothetical protein
MPSRSYLRSRCGSRDGIALLMVLAVIVLLTILVVSLIAFNKLNRTSTASYSKSIQAQEIAQGGLQDILSDLHKEIIAGSYTNATIYAPNGGPMIYVPTTNYTAAPARVGYSPSSWGNDVSSPNLNNLSPTLIRVSRVSQDGTPTHFYPSFITNTAYYDATLSPNLINRASAANTATPSANGRFISAARWNKTFLLATTTDTNSAANGNLSIPAVFATNYTSTSGSSMPSTQAPPPPPPYGPPDWVYVTRTGSRVCTNTATELPLLLPSGNLTQSYGTATPGANPPASPVVGRYAFVMYDEGALLDMNVAGYTSTSANIVSSPADPTTGITQSVNGKSYLSYADLTKVGMKNQTNVDKFLAWRNASSVSSGNSYLTAVFGSYAKNGFLSFLSGDSPLLGRQDLINYFAKLDPNFNTINASFNALPYMGTFTRDVNAPSYSPPVDASVLGGNNGGTPGIYSYHANAEVSTAAPFSGSSPNPNRDIPNVRFQNAGTVTHYGDAPTVSPTPTYTVKVGDPLVQSRFSLAKINWLSQANPASGAGPASTTAIQACFGLTWGVVGSANGGNACWSYVGSPAGPSGTLAPFNGTIETLDQVALEGREPNFFELLKAAILSGSLGLSPGPAAFSNGNAGGAAGPSGGFNYHDDSPLYTAGGSDGLYSYTFDRPGAIPSPSRVSDMQIMRIGANIIDQYDADSYPTAIYFQYSGITNKYDASVAGTPDHNIYGPVDMVYGDENLPELQGMVIPVCTTNGAAAGDGTANGLGSWWQPEIWNPHQSPNSANSSVSPPTKYIIQGYGSAYTYWQNSTTGHTGYSVTEAFDGTSIAFTDTAPTTSAFYDNPRMLIQSGIPNVTSTGSNTAKMNANPLMFNYSGNPFVGFWAGTEVNYEGGNTTYFGRTESVPNPAVSFCLGWSATGSDFHPYSYLSGIFADSYGVIYANSSPPTPGAAAGDADPFGTQNEWHRYVEPRTTRFSNFAGWGVIDNTTFFPNSSTHRNDNYGWGRPSASNFTFAHIIQAGTWFGNFDGDWNVNQANPLAQTGATATYYSDPDGVVRPADGVYGNTSSGDGMMLFNSAGTGGTALGDTTTTGNGTGNTQHGRRPIILDRPFRSVGELGYAFRDLPFKTLDFFSQYSADAALLDIFSITDEAKVTINNQLSAIVAGRISPGNAPYEVIAAVLSGGSKKDLDPSYNMSTEITTVAQAADNQFLSTGAGPMLNRADLVTRMMPKSLGGMIAGFNKAPDKSNKTYWEAPVRALADVTNTRTWNLLIDVIAQSGHMSPTATTLDNFIVEGEKRYWLHIAIDRCTGKIVDQQLEPVYE